MSLADREPTWLFLLRMRLLALWLRLRWWPERVRHCDTCYTPARVSQLSPWMTRSGETQLECRECRWMRAALQSIADAGEQLAQQFLGRVTRG